jgi:hypothetical protein
MKTQECLTKFKKWLTKSQNGGVTVAHEKISKNGS